MMSLFALRVLSGFGKVGSARFSRIDFYRCAAQAFKAFDKDHKGMMAVTEFQTVMQHLSRSLHGSCTFSFPAHRSNSRVLAFRSISGCTRFGSLELTSRMRQVMRNFGEALNDDEVDQLLNASQSCEVRCIAQPHAQDLRALAARHTSILMCTISSCLNQGDAVRCRGRRHLA